ncbi:MAG: hypothetical protein U0941_29890 [Planctomycetaceae bacterium]
MTARAESDHLKDLSDSAREKNSGEKKSAEKKSHRNHERHSSSCCSRCNNSPCTCSSLSSDDNSIAGRVFLGVVFSPFTLTKSIIESEESDGLSFLDFPYANDLPGSMVNDPAESIATDKLSGTLQAFVIPETDDMIRYGGRLLVESSNRFGIDTETNCWTESLNSGNSQLWIGDANLVYRFAQSEITQCRAGIGVNWMADSAGAEAGFNFTYGFDWFPRKPWTISTTFDAGTLGGSSLFHNRTTAGVMLGPVEAFAGYDYFKVGSTNFHGPVAGLGWRF